MLDDETDLNVSSDLLWSVVKSEAEKLQTGRPDLTAKR